MLCEIPHTAVLYRVPHNSQGLQAPGMPPLALRATDTESRIARSAGSQGEGSINYRPQCIRLLNGSAQLHTPSSGVPDSHLPDNPSAPTARRELWSWSWLRGRRAWQEAEAAGGPSPAPPRRAARRRAITDVSLGWGNALRS